MKANLEASDEDRLPESEILAQMTFVAVVEIFAAHLIDSTIHRSSFLLAGMDTTSGALSRILHQLALHPEVQEKLRIELTEARERDGDLDFDTLHSLPYMEAVVRETLRL